MLHSCFHAPVPPWKLRLLRRSTLATTNQTLAAAGQTLATAGPTHATAGQTHAVLTLTGSHLGSHQRRWG